MPGIGTYIDVFERLESAHLKINKNACVRVRNRNVTCTRCAKACPSGCITTENNELKVDPSQCIGCATCTTACLTGALVAREPSDSQLLGQMLQATEAGDGKLTVACSKMLERAGSRVDATRVVGVTCLGRLEESVLASAVRHGATHIFLVHGGCDDCPHRLGVVSARCVVATVNLLLQTWGSPVQAELCPKFPAYVAAIHDGYDASRRSFFQNMGGSAKSALGIVGEYTQEQVLGEPPGVNERLFVEEDGTLPHWLPERRARLVNALNGLGEPSDRMLSTRLWGKVRIDYSKCRTCYMCATFCPSGALLKVMQNGVAMAIAHRSAACVKCHSCEQICPKGAITVEDAVNARELAAGSVEYMRVGVEQHPEDDQDSLYGKLASLMDFGNARDLGSSR